MRSIDGRLVLGATDLSDFLACEHLTQLEVLRAHGEQLPRATTPLSELLARLGGEHESRWLEMKQAAGARVRPFNPDDTRSAEHLADLERAADETLAAMREGWDIISQPFFFDGVWQGRADFLVRVERPSALGDHSYEVYDAKLARHVRVEALLQLSEYSLHAARAMGAQPEHMHVALGDGSTGTFLVSDFAAYHRMIREQLLTAVRGAGSYPEKVAHCGICDYAAFCDGRRRADAHLSLVARMRRDQIHKLNAAGVRRVEELAVLPPQEGVAGIAQPALEALRAQARLQVAGAAHPDAPPLWELLPRAEPGFGLEALPVPSRWDVFFDMEGDTFAHEERIEYLFGVVEMVGGELAYRSWMGHTPADERRAFESFIDWLMRRLDEHPEMHVYHYADYERSALQRLMGRHATREPEVDRLLRGAVLVDLYRVVRQSLRLSTEGYGLKNVERLYMPMRSGDVADAESSLVTYAQWLETGDDALLEGIVRYNEVDCVSTARLRDWLEQRRAEVVREQGVALERPSVRDGAAPESVASQDDETERLRARLFADIPDDAAQRTDGQHAAWLLAQLLGYHRREQKVEWWRWFGHVAMTEDELQNDREALGPLTPAGTIGTQKKSDIVRYTFEPQEHAVRDGSNPTMPCLRDGARDGCRAGTVNQIDNLAGTVDLVRGTATADRGEPRFLFPGQPFGARAQAESLVSAGQHVAEHGIDAHGPYRAARDLLQRKPPRGAGGGPLRRPGESAEDAAVRVAASVDGGCLAVQGPPGSGKTFTAARIALELVARGRRVGVTATAHKVIGRLLEEIADAAASRSQTLRIVQKCAEGEQCSAGGVRRADRNEEVIAALEAGDADVAGGTAWLFADANAAGCVDTLIVDEAAQMSLADVVACSRAARNLVLVGDPRQLAQVVQGSHPPGVGVSALAHLLRDQPTIAPDAGIFLDRTWRMAPEVCAFVSEAFYQGRLEPVDSTRVQTVDGVNGTPLRGLYEVPVEHEGDRTFSVAEAERVREVFTDLLGRRWRHRDGSERVVGVADILVVAPYNAHVATLAAKLPAGARVGTVDRFQGQEAAVSIFSMATSSTEDLPRNLEFLYSTHRLNVAVSRARCVSVLVHSPALLHTRCRTPEQMRLVNALCRYVEAASPWPSRRARDAPRQLSLLAC
ncbi:MAG: TM0106 family RecB-like putative nuclease [Candidatus Dormibacteria bacterium]